MTDPEKLARVRARIANLIAKAERTEHAEEAATFFAAAEELMLEYNLDLETDPTQTTQPAIVRRTFKFGGPSLYWRPWIFGANAIVLAVDRVMMAVNNRSREFILYGTETDCEYAEILLKSAWRSAWNHMRQETRGNSQYLFAATNADRSRFRKNYVEGFGNGVADKIRQTHEASGMHLVLAKRKEAIASAMYADGIRVGQTSGTHQVLKGAYSAGYDQGSRAALGRVLV